MENSSTYLIHTVQHPDAVFITKSNSNLTHVQLQRSWKAIWQDIDQITIVLTRENESQIVRMVLYLEEWCFSLIIERKYMTLYYQCIA